MVRAGSRRGDASQSWLTLKARLPAGQRKIEPDRRAPAPWKPEFGRPLRSVHGHALPDANKTLARKALRTGAILRARKPVGELEAATGPKLAGMIGHPL